MARRTVSEISLVLFMAFFMLCRPALALETFKILDVSKSKHTVVIDRGLIDGIKPGARSKFLFQSGHFTHPKLENLGSGICVKSLDNWSYWLLEVINAPSKIVKGAKIVSFSEKEIISGRKNLKILKRKVISSRPMTVKEVEFKKRTGMPSALVEEESKYSHGRKMSETEMAKHQDIEAVQYRTWKKKSYSEYNDDYESEISSLYDDESAPGISSTGVQSHYYNDIHTSQTKGVIKKTNSLKFGIKGLHRGSDDRLAKLSIVNIYDKYKEKKKRKRILGESVDLKYMSEGQLWSADFSDRHLRNYIVQSGIEREEIAQRDALLELSGNEITFSFDNALSNTTSSKDINHQSNSYYVTLGYEYHLGKSFLSLNKWSAEVFYQGGVGHYSLSEDVNGRFAESSFGGALNYYLWNKPSTLKSLLVYIGGGYKRGTATATSIELSKDYSYQVVALPFAHVGIKYRFRSGDALDDDVPVGLGFFGRATMENLTLTPIDTIDTTDNIEGSQTIANFKFSVGLSFYF